jgi:hypothetical protein
MSWILIGGIVLLLALFLLGLFFNSSGALVIAQEEKEGIEHETPEEIAKEVEEEERVNKEILKEEEGNYHSVGQYEE